MRFGALGARDDLELRPAELLDLEASPTRRRERRRRRPRRSTCAAPNAAPGGTLIFRSKPLNALSSTSPWPSSFPNASLRRPVRGVRGGERRHRRIRRRCAPAGTSPSRARSRPGGRSRGRRTRSRSPNRRPSYGLHSYSESAGRSATSLPFVAVRYRARTELERGRRPSASVTAELSVPPSCTCTPLSGAPSRRFVAHAISWSLLAIASTPIDVTCTHVIVGRFCVVEVVVLGELPRRRDDHDEVTGRAVQIGAQVDRRLGELVPAAVDRDRRRRESLPARQRRLVVAAPVLQEVLVVEPARRIRGVHVDLERLVPDRRDRHRRASSPTGRWW